MNSIDVVLKIIELNKNIKKIYFLKFPKYYPLQERRTFNKIENKYLNSAIKTRCKLNLPFWDALMLTLIQKNKAPLSLLDNVFRHNQHLRIRAFLTKDRESIF